jgi:hypothetical protein
MSAMQLELPAPAALQPETLARRERVALPFPVLATTIRAYRDVAENPGTAFRLVAAWLAALLVVGVCALMAVGLTVVAGGGAPDAKPGTATGIAIGLAAVSIGMLVAVATASIAVGWLRFLLLAERPSRIHLRMGALVWRYIWATVVLFALLLVMLLPASLSLALLVGASGSSHLAEVMPGLLNVLALIGGARLMVAMPAVALGKPRALIATLSRTRGATARLTLATALSMVPWQIMLQIWSVVAPDGTAVQLTPTVLLLALAGALAWILAILGSLSVAAQAWRHFVEPAPADAAAK